MATLKYFEKAIYNYNNGKYGQAITFFNKCIMENIRTVQSYQYLGNIYLELEEYSCAIEHYCRAMESKNGNIYIECLVNRGVCYLNSGDIENANIDFNEYLNFVPNDENVIKMKLYCEFTKMGLQPSTSQFN